MARSIQQRNQYPAALLKDRHSRSGMPKTDNDHKAGAGAHNWGSLSREGQYETEARDDADADKEREQVEDGESKEQIAPLPRKNSGDANPGLNNSSSFEAVSPTDSMASLDSAASGPTPPKDLKGVGRRLSNVSEEEREKARQYREGVRASGGPTSLADIAKTSFGVSSPPNENGFGTSPTKFKAATAA